jgi:hypothetical protein
MPDLANLTSAISPLAGLVPTTAAVAGAAPDQGGFQAILAGQTAELASNPVAATLLPPLAVMAAVLPGLAVGGNGTLPDDGKILPDASAVADAGTDIGTHDGTDGEIAASEAPAKLDPAILLMLNATPQPAPNAPPVPANTATPSATPLAPVAQQAIAQRVAASPAAQLAVSAQAAPAADTTPIDIAPQDSALSAQPAVTLRPVTAPPAGQPRQNDDAARSGAEHSASFTDPQAITASEDASRTALPPTPGIAEASAGVVPTAPATAPTDTPANPIAASAVTQRPNDMATLVDRLVEARQAARMSGPQSVVASISHGDFGRVSLDFRQDSKGLSVGMTSHDPAFAPAAQAALAQQQQVNATNTGNDTGNPQGNSSSGNPSFFTQGSSSQSAGQFSGNQSGAGHRPAADWSAGADIAANPSQPLATGDSPSRQNGILA